jgi:hypothetical protein
MTREHPITPPPELVQAWSDEALTASGMFEVKIKFATCAAQWGADQELEACCSIALTDPVCGTKHQRSMLVRHMRERRRPKSQSLKEQALVALHAVAVGANDMREQRQDLETIRLALEQLP